MRAHITALLVALAFAAGCASTPSPAPEAPTIPGPVALDRPLDPAGIAIPAIGVESTLIGLGADPDGTWAEPDVQHPEQASWFTGGPTPGSRGPAVILGHVNGGGHPGVFARLGEITTGAEITVLGKDARAATFVVFDVQHAAKTAFPADEVLAPVADAHLRLITCGGDFDAATHHYLGSVIVYAKLRK